MVEIYINQISPEDFYILIWQICQIRLSEYREK